MLVVKVVDTSVLATHAFDHANTISEIDITAALLLVCCF